MPASSSNPWTSARRVQAMLDVIERATRRLTSSLDPADIIREMVEQSSLLFPSCSVFLRAPGEATASLLVLRHPDGDRAREIEQILRGQPARIGEGLIGKVFSSGEAVFLPEVAPSDLPVPRRVYPPRLTPHSTLAAPISVEGETIGVLCASALPGDPKLTAEEFRAARVLADLAGQALTNARRFQEAQLARSRSEATGRVEAITRGISQTLDLDAALKRVRDAAVETLGFDRAGVFVIDAEMQEIRGVWGTDNERRAERIDDQRFPLSNPDQFGRIARREIPYYLTQTYFDAGPPVDHVGAYAAAPFDVGGDVLGILAVDNVLSGRSITEQDVLDLGPFCDHAALAIRNARLHQALQRQIRSLQTLQEIGDEVRASMDPETVLSTLVVRSRDWADASESAVLLYHEESDTLVWHFGNGQSKTRYGPLLRGVSPILTRELAPLTFRCLDERRAFAVSGPDDPLLSPDEAGWARDEEISAAAALPLFTPNATFGVLLLAHRGAARRFRPDEVALLQSLASHGSVALEKARLYHASEEARQRTVEINRSLRRAFVPELPDQVPGLSIGELFAPASNQTQLGGDFYDLFRLGRSRYGIVIGDVAGHDLRSSVQTAAAKYLLRAFAERSRHTHTVVSHLNAALMNQFHAPDFISLFFGILDVGSGRLTFTNAGHELPLVLPEDGSPPIVLAETDTLLAVEAESRYREQQVDFPVGSMLLLYTDGVTEARRGAEFLLTEGLTEALKGCSTKSAQGLVDDLWQKILDFADPLRDDAAMLALKRTAR